MYKKFIHSRIFPIMILFLSVGMIYYGYNNGEDNVVLDKAIRICMECIGIG